MPGGRDRWHRWLTGGRFGDDVGHRETQLAEFLYPVRDRVLDRAQLVAGETLLDAGCGDGLIAFGALDRVGPAGRVIFCDISHDLLGDCRKAAAAEDVHDRSGFALVSADGLAGVAAGSVDVVTTRSVLIYVKDKAAALRGFHRVLKPGGRVSLLEPVNALMTDEPGRFLGYDVTPVRDVAAKVEAVYESIQPPGDDPMTDFDERDLVRHAVDAGFTEVGLELQVSVKSRKEPVPWERFMRTSGNPLVPSFGEAVDRALSPEEAAELTGYLRPLVESGAGLDRMALAYVSAVKK